MCSLGIEPTTFALLAQCSNHWATQEHCKFFEFESLQIMRPVGASALHAMA